MSTRFEKIKTSPKKFISKNKSINSPLNSINSKKPNSQSNDSTLTPTKNSPKSPKNYKLSKANASKSSPKPKTINPNKTAPAPNCKNWNKKTKTSLHNTTKKPTSATSPTLSYKKPIKKVSNSSSKSAITKTKKKNCPWLKPVSLSSSWKAKTYKIFTTRCCRKSSVPTVTNWRNQWLSFPAATIFVWGAKKGTTKSAVSAKENSRFKPCIETNLWTISLASLAVSGRLLTS